VADRNVEVGALNAAQSHRGGGEKIRALATRPAAFGAETTTPWTRRTCYTLKDNT